MLVISAPAVSRSVPRFSLARQPAFEPLSEILADRRRGMWQCTQPLHMTAFGHMTTGNQPKEPSRALASVNTISFGSEGTFQATVY
jgi:hypothetical protein